MGGFFRFGLAVVICCIVTTPIFAQDLSSTKAVPATPPDPQQLVRKSAKAFTHPGLLHTQSDLARMKEMVAQGAEPWKSGFEKLRLHRQSRSDWVMRGPFPRSCAIRAAAST